MTIRGSATCTSVLALHPDWYAAIKAGNWTNDIMLSWHSSTAVDAEAVCNGIKKTGAMKHAHPSLYQQLRELASVNLLTTYEEWWLKLHKSLKSTAQSWMCNKFWNQSFTEDIPPTKTEASMQINAHEPNCKWNSKVDRRIKHFKVTEQRSYRNSGVKKKAKMKRILCTFLSVPDVNAPVLCNAMFLQCEYADADKRLQTRIVLILQLQKELVQASSEPTKCLYWRCMDTVVY